MTATAPEAHAAGGRLDFIPVLEGWRGYAALYVVLHHCWVAAYFPALDGGLGRALIGGGPAALDFFFVVSGFVLFLPVARNGGRFGSVSAYAVRRFARIAPAFYASLLGIVLLWPLVSPDLSTNFFTWTNVQALGAHLPFLHHVLLGLLEPGLLPGFEGFRVNPAIWSLTVEFMFYVLLPLVAGAYFRRPFLGLAVAVAIQLVWRGAMWEIGERLGPAWDEREATQLVGQLSAQLPGFAGNLAAGMTAAYLYVVLSSGAARGLLASAARHTVAIQMAAVALLLATLVLVGEPNANRETFVAVDVGVAYATLRNLVPALLCAVIALAAAAGPDRAAWFWTNPFARWLGRVSYGMFLWHSIVIWFAIRQLDMVGDGSNRLAFEFAAIVVPASALLGWLSFRFVEGPSQRWARTVIRARRARVEPAATSPDRA